MRDVVHRHWRRLLRRARWRAAAHGALAAAGASGLLALAAAAWLAAGAPPAWARWLAALLVLAGAGAAAAWFLVRPLLRLRSAGALARALERAGVHENALVAAEESLRRPDRWREDDPAAAELVRRLRARAGARLAAVDLRRDLPLRGARLAPALAALALVAAVAGAWLDGAHFARGWDRLLRPGHDPGAGRPDLVLAPFADHVIAGEDAVVAALDHAAAGGVVICEVRAGSGAWRPLPAEAVAPAADAAAGARTVRWETRLTAVQEDLEFRFRRAAQRTQVGRLAVWQPPLLGELAATVRPPAYTRLPATELARLPSFLDVPAGSRLELRGRASAPLRDAVAVEVGGDAWPLRVAGEVLVGEVAVDRSLTLRLDLTDRRGLAGVGGLEYHVAAVPDEPPLVGLLRARAAGPGDGGGEPDDRLPLAAPLLLQLTARDDYGVAACDLLLRRAGETAWQRVAARPQPAREEATDLGRLRLRVDDGPAADAREVHRLISLDAAGLALVPGETLELCAEARDNREPPPAGVGRSAILRLAVPSSADVLAEHAQADSTARADLAESRRRSADLARDLERLRREMLKDPLPDWDQQQELRAALQRREDLQKELDRLAEELRGDLESLAANRLTSEEVLARMDEIAQLMQEARSTPLQELLDALRESMAQVSPDELQRAVDQLAKDQQDMLRRMDTALAMLQDLARQQELEGLTSMLAQMMREQQELAERAQSSRPDDAEREGERDGERPQAEGERPPESGEESGEQPDARDAPQPTDEELARRQDALAQELSSLRERMEEALAKLQEQQQEGPESPAGEKMREALEQALEQLSQQQTQEDMRKAGEQLAQGQPSQAAPQMQQSLAELAGLYSVLLRTQSAMQMAMQQMQSGALRGLAADLLALSERQERIHLDLPAQIQDLRVEPLARRQHEVLRSTIGVRDGLAEVASAAPQEILRLLGRLDDLLDTLGRAVRELEEGRGAGARSSTRDGLADMNRVVIGLLTQAQMTGSGGGMGSSNPMPRLTQQLREMASEQAGLNALAEQMRRQQGLSEQLRSQMQRLQQGQQGLSGRARELAEEQERVEAEDGPRLLGDLRAMADEMERVADDLGGGLVTDETLRRQERILSRLLDAHNSSRERDFARRRESRPADDLMARQGGLDGAGPAADDPALRRYEPVEKAPPAYRDLVRRYFEALRELQPQGDAGGGT